MLQISVFFKKTKFTLLKFIYFHYKTPPKQILVFFQIILGKSLIWEKSSGMWESDFNENNKDKREK